ncbi:galactosyl transferase GMA12/MNN10 family-domain-containing protein [Dactylonectria macrodidyma]|uniref:Galactosyl transferase GMA12/MNN10 family-domain-containing protein n=1 Tax=Dactylonectria macrodidyma TaxID=307937 RepID=A0A9P9FD67_9HYPO|nr:galactosyl transferase GMA12/MNN10 family-domain-containing protein [Dactylonectria macrodidyma]
MQFAYPPRKSSNPPPFRPRTSNIPLRPSRLRTILLLVLGVVGLFWLLSGPRKETPYREHVPSGKPPVVILTVIDPTKYSDAYLKTITDNREQYAAKHGYEIMTVRLFDYDTKGAPQSWARIIAIRHALSLYPEAKFVWLLDQNAYIMELDMSLEEQLTNPAKLEELMIKDRSIVPPDSIIKTFTHLKGEEAAFIISQDDAGLVTNSFLVRNGDWAKFFIETWMDPLYRSYNFQKAERHALVCFPPQIEVISALLTISQEHIVQWHPTILSKLALVPQRTIASYGRNKEGNSYRDGDFVALLVDCHPTGPNSCDKQSQSYLNQLQVKAAAAAPQRS